MSDAYAKLLDRMKEIAKLGSIEALLDWDQETQMPEHGVGARAEQIAMISGLAHEKLIDPETKSLLAEASAAPGDYVAETNIREFRRDYNRSSCIPTKLVKDLSHASTLAKSAWAKARENDSFGDFLPLFERMIELKRQVAECVGYEKEPYDALLDEFEPGARTEEIETLFAQLSEETVKLLRRLEGAPVQPDASMLSGKFPIELQKEWCQQLLSDLCFDSRAGRQDTSVHPFCITIGGSGDVRITTRYMEDYFPAAVFGTIHECGHALYEQGLLREHGFTPMAEPVSLGIHESQSRFWENMIGRSKAFWGGRWGLFKQLFSESLGDATLEQFYAAIHQVRPSFIRVEADELTYNLHIALRFELERALISGDLIPKDVPQAWNERFESMLGIVPPNDCEGCLQDIHWSMGMFGYFPTYALGNLYAAQFYDQIRADLPDIDDMVQEGEMTAILDWLRQNIHQHGQRYRAGELVEHVTGKPLSIEPFMNYVTSVYSEVYGL